MMFLPYFFFFFFKPRTTFTKPSMEHSAIAELTSFELYFLTRRKHLWSIERRKKERPCQCVVVMLKARRHLHLGNLFQTISVLYSNVVSVSNPLRPVMSVFLHLCSIICRRCSQTMPQRTAILNVIQILFFCEEGAKATETATFSF